MNSVEYIGSIIIYYFCLLARRLLFTVSLMYSATLLPDGITVFKILGQHTEIREQVCFVP
jgi:hypothetical protein